MTQLWMGQAARVVAVVEEVWGEVGEEEEADESVVQGVGQAEQTEHGQGSEGHRGSPARPQVVGRGHGTREHRRAG